MNELTESFRAFTKIITTRLKGKLFKLNFAITYKCNSRCKMCNTWKRYIEKPWMLKKELEIEEIHQIFKGFGKLVWVSLTGGEPFLRDDIADIVNSVRDNCQIKMLNITTNCLSSKLIEDRVRDIAEVKVPLTCINVSIDGPAQIHDYMRGIKGAYDSAVKTLEILNLLRDEYSNLLIGFEYTITSFNAGYLKLLIDELTKTKLSWVLENVTITLYHEGYLYNNLGLNSKQQVTDEIFKFKALKDINDGLNLAHVKSPLALIKRTYLKRARRYILDENVPLQCTAQRNSLFLNPYGDVYPCIILGHKIGNLRNYNYNVYELLKSENALKLKYEIQNCNKCWTPCEAYPSILTHLSSLIKAGE